MSQHDLLFSREGHHWTPKKGLQDGLATVGVIQPSSNSPSNRVYDVVILGAGYTGLVAARDLTMAGLDVLLVEGRDRIGGRTWSTKIEGHTYDIGGTWVHWHQPFVWRELCRYGLSRDLEVTPAEGFGLDECWIHCRDGSTVKIPRAQEFDLMSSMVKKFVNVDGNLGRDVIPFPWDVDHNPLAAQYDKMSFADRINQIRHELTPVELDVLETFLSCTSGGTMENSGFLDFLRWWAVNNYDMHWFEQLCLGYHLKEGQSSLARAIFDEAEKTGNLTYQFGTAVTDVQDDGGQVVISTRNGHTFHAKHAVSTIPLNVLSTVKFSPALSAKKKAAADLGHVNLCTKVHIEAANPGLRTFAGWNYNSPLGMSFGDGITPAGNAHVVAFGPSYEGVRLNGKANDGQDAVKAAKALAPGQFDDIVRLVYHDWVEDEFSKGAWEFLRPGMATKYVDELRTSQGNILFANADWATGWRGFIDGAVEEGQRAAKEITDKYGARKTQEEKSQRHHL